MATATKNLRTIVAASTSNTSGSTTTGTAINLTTALGGLLTAKITNGGTGPTVACDLVIEVSGDNTNWKTFARFRHTTANNDVGEWAVNIPVGTMYVRAVFTGNTVQAVTVEAFLQELTSIG